jgi:hypothetical protein
MKSLVTLQLAVLLDAGRFVGVHVDRDSDYIRSRSEREGEEFLTITLPTLSKALEKGLRDGVWPRQDVTNFRYARGLPNFLRGFLSRVFSDTGNLLDDPDANAIWALRQITGLSGKVFKTTTPERESAAMKAFIQTDRELGEHFRWGIPDWMWRDFSKARDLLFTDLFDKLESRIANFELIPSHGPGSVADRLDHPERWRFPYWPERLQEVFPSWRYTENVSMTFSRELVNPGAEIPVRVIAVPKTAAKPRIIAIEPSAMQYAQQGLKNEIYREVSESLLNGVLGFTDQSRNQRLAHRASVDGSLATLDLSEASDRVHLSVVMRLFERWPHLRDFVLATRSRIASVEGEEILLHKFASMGSALTFPIEAMVFTTILSAASPHGPLPVRALLRNDVSVYGDDIVVPVDWTSRVVDRLESFGFKVNKSKSFWTGKFRESCGTEYFNGTDVSIVRLRADIPLSREDAALIRKFTDFRNRCYRNGLWATVKESDRILDQLVKIPPRWYPTQIDFPASVLAKDTCIRPKWRGVYDASYQTWYETFPTVKADPSPYIVEGAGGLLKWFHENHGRLWSSTEAFESQERARTFRIKRARLEMEAIRL